MDRSSQARLTVLTEALGLMTKLSDERKRVNVIFNSFATLGMREGYRFRVALLDQSSEFARIVYAFPDYPLFDIGRFQIATQKSIIGYSLEERRPLLIDNTHESYWDDLWFTTDPMSLLVFPLIRNGIAFGTLSIDFHSPNGFDEEAVVHLIPFADLLASAMDLGSSQSSYTDVVSVVSRFRERQVLVLGKDNGEEVERLREIAALLREMRYKPLLVKDYPDFPELSNEEKVRVFADSSRFVVLENSFPAGQIAELKMCATNRIITAALRESGRGSSYMVTDYFADFQFIREFEYRNEGELLKSAVRLAVEWAEAQIRSRTDYFNALYPWRNGLQSDG